MRFADVLVAIILTTAAFAQSAPKLASRPGAKSVTVPITLSHNRIIIDVDIPLPDGATQRVHAWVDTGNPDLYLSSRLAAFTGSVSCDGQHCSVTPPPALNIAGMTIPLGGRIPGAGIKEAKVPAGGAPIAPGLDAEINIPSTILRNYDVLINYPDHELTIAQSGVLIFKGVTTKVFVNPANGLIQIPSQIEKKKYNLALDLGAPVSFLAEELFDKLAAAHFSWPHMTGAIGPANISGLNDEPKRKIMRVDHLQYGPLFLTNLAVVDLPADQVDTFAKRAGAPTLGLLGADALMNYRIGLDYAHSVVYFDIGRLSKFPAFDVVGLILRPENDGSFTIIGIADYNGEPSVPQVNAGDHLIAVDGIPVLSSTLGQVWLMLGGDPGKERKLTVEREGKQFTVIATVQRFLEEIDDSEKSKGKSGRN